MYPHIVRWFFTMHFSRMLGLVLLNIIASRVGFY
jgi:hypothetical protein